MSPPESTPGIPTQAADPAHRFAVVTGASSGIGRELARQFAQNGFDVLVAAEDDGIDAVAQELRSTGQHAEALRVDLATTAGTEELALRMRTVGRPVDALALNAGVGVGGGAFLETPLEDHMRLIDLNVGHVVRLARLVVPAMVTRGAGRVLVTSSVAASMPGPWYATYAASKAFVQSFAEALRVEVQGTGVTVTALQPGPTDTEFFARAGMEDTKVAEGRKDDPAKVAAEGFTALMAGDDHVVVGLRNKGQVLTGNALPDAAGARIHGAMTKPQDEG
jgi:short-subunit dehydrogenase